MISACGRANQYERWVVFSSPMSPWNLSSALPALLPRNFLAYVPYQHCQQRWVPVQPIRMDAVCYRVHCSRLSMQVPRLYFVQTELSGSATWGERTRQGASAGAGVLSDTAAWLLQRVRRSASGSGGVQAGSELDIANSASSVEDISTSEYAHGLPSISSMYVS